jgi:ATPase subunit of ABC transporter with duplicated ATPase domains
LITFTDVAKSFDERPALTGVSLAVTAGARTAVVGPNGSGKSTLLKLAAGLLSPDTGTVTVAPGATVAYVPQDYGVAAGDTVAGYVKERAGLRGLEQRLRRLEPLLAGGDAAVMDAYADALERYGLLGGWELEGRLDAALARVGLPASVLDRPLGELSGGQQVRVGLAGVLASRFSVYLLDEPTNNLDLDGLELLEDWLSGSDAAFLIVSHDRALLSAVAREVVELDPHDHTAEAFGVSFAEYRELRAQALAARWARYNEVTGEAARLRAGAAAQQATAARTRDHRPARDNDKFIRHFLTERSASQAARLARRLEKRLQRLEQVEKPRTPWELRLSLEAASRSGDRVAAAAGVTKTYGAFALGPLDLELRHRDRVALAGHNGAGKSVLLGLLTGTLQPDAGTVSLGAGVRPGVLRQGGADLGGPDAGLTVFRRALPWPEADARTLLAKFDLGAAHVLRPTATWSPGERCRLGLAILMASGANFLVLDEPTNHLDLEAQEELEQALAGFDGTLLLVSHDRELLDRIGVNRRIELVDGKLADQRSRSAQVDGNSARP